MPGGEVAYRGHFSLPFVNIDPFAALSPARDGCNIALTSCRGVDLFACRGDKNQLWRCLVPLFEKIG
jgi:hypothetical protein